MLLEKILISIGFDKEIESLKNEEELGIYEEKGKSKINYPLFAEVFLKKFNIIKEAKQGKEKFDYYIYGENHWILIDSDLLKGLVRKLLYSLDFMAIGANIEERLTKEILNLAKRIEEVDIMHHKMNFLDCVYSFMKKEFEPLDSKNYFINAKEYGREEMNIVTPIFDKFMLDIMCNDIDAVNFLLQLMGNCISGLQKLEKFTVFVGAGSNGKSTLLKLLSNIVGDNYVETRDINKLDDRFAIQGLDRKKLLISSESSNKKDISTETLKKLTTPNEKVYMDIKNEKARTVELSLNLIFACNQPIEFGKMDINDKSIARRLIVIPFNRVFSESEKDRDLDKKLEAEIPGITLKLIKAYEELVNNNYILPKSELIDEATEDYLAKHIFKEKPSNKIKEFLDMYLEKDGNAVMSIRYMYEKFMKTKNIDELTYQTFAKEIRLAIPIKDKRDPSLSGKTVLDVGDKNSSRYYVGYKLRETPLGTRRQIFSNNQYFQEVI